jgi:hypothetical protein
MQRKVVYLSAKNRVSKYRARGTGGNGLLRGTWEKGERRIER